MATRAEIRAGMQAGFVRMRDDLQTKQVPWAAEEPPAVQEPKPRRQRGRRVGVGVMTPLVAATALGGLANMRQEQPDTTPHPVAVVRTADHMQLPSGSLILTTPEPGPGNETQPPVIPEELLETQNVEGPDANTLLGIAQKKLTDAGIPEPSGELQNLTASVIGAVNEDVPSGNLLGVESVKVPKPPILQALAEVSNGSPRVPESLEVAVNRIEDLPPEEGRQVVQDLLAHSRTQELIAQYADMNNADQPDASAAPPPSADATTSNPVPTPTPAQSSQPAVTHTETVTESAPPPRTETTTVTETETAPTPSAAQYESTDLHDEQPDLTQIVTHEIEQANESYTDTRGWFMEIWMVAANPNIKDDPVGPLSVSKVWVPTAETTDRLINLADYNQYADQVESASGQIQNPDDIAEERKLRLQAGADKMRELADEMGLTFPDTAADAPADTPAPAPDAPAPEPSAPTPPGEDHTNPYTPEYGDTVSELVREGMERAGKDPTDIAVAVGVAAIGAVNPDHDNLDVIRIDCPIEMLDDATLGKISDASDGRISPQTTNEADDVEHEVVIGKDTNYDGYDRPETRQQAAELLAALGVQVPPAPDQGGGQPPAPDGHDGAQDGGHAVTLPDIPAPDLTPQLTDAQLQQDINQAKAHGWFLVDTLHRPHGNIWEQQDAEFHLTDRANNLSSRTSVVLSDVDHAVSPNERFDQYTMHHGDEFINFNPTVMEIFRGVASLTPNDITEIRTSGVLNDAAFNELYTVWLNNYRTTSTPEETIQQGDRRMAEIAADSFDDLNPQTIPPELRDFVASLHGKKPSELREMIRQNLPTVQVILEGASDPPPPAGDPGPGPAAPGGEPGDDTPPGGGAGGALEKYLVHVDLPNVPDEYDVNLEITPEILRDPAQLTDDVDRAGNAIQAYNVEIDAQQADIEADALFEAAIREQIPPGPGINPNIDIPPVPYDQEEGIPLWGHIVGATALASGIAAAAALYRRNRRALVVPIPKATTPPKGSHPHP